jgi:peptidoglycan/LPS O-acetylase OafA/YrhL
MLFHFETRLKGGYLGVDMFFVISGFVIASSTLREIDRTGTFSWSAFLHRRVRRLLPGTALVACGVALLSMLFLSPFGPQKETAKMLLSAATYTSNFVLMPQSYFSLDPKANPLLHLWSLAVEEQFYFVWPMAILVFVGLRKRLEARVVKAIVWLAVIAVLLASCWLFLKLAIHGSQVNDYRWFGPIIQRNVTPEHFAFYSPFTRAWEFVAGVVVALLLRLKTASFVLKAGSIVTWCGVVLVLIGVAWASKYPEIQRDGNWSTNTSATLAVVAGTALWIFGGAHGGFIRRLLSIRPLIFIGDCSYSIYLLHWPIWVLLITSIDQGWRTIAIAFALSFGLGWLQFRFVEEPIRLRKRLPSAKTLKFVGVFGLVAVVGFVAMSYTTPLIAVDLTGKKPGELSLHIIENPCAGDRFDLESAQSCLFPSVNSKGTAILVGDSMAKSLSDGFVLASNREGLNGYVFSYPGCAFLLSDSPFSATNECVAWRENVMNALRQLQPTVLMIANLSSLYVEQPFPEWTLSDTESAWGSELSRTLKSLVELRTQVIVVQPPPRFAYDLRYDISLLRPNSVTEPRSDVVNRRKKINQIEESAISGMQQVRPAINFTDLFCDSQLCDPRVEGIFMFEDSDHLSVEGSLFVAEQLRIAITETMSIYASSLSE